MKNIQKYKIALSDWKDTRDWESKHGVPSGLYSGPKPTVKGFMD